MLDCGGSDNRSRDGKRGWTAVGRMSMLRVHVLLAAINKIKSRGAATIFAASPSSSSLLYTPCGSKITSLTRFATRSITWINFHKGPVLEPVWASWGLSSRLDKNEMTRSLIYIQPNWRSNG